MTVSQLDNYVKKYFGLSTDTKPTDGVRPGYTFYETDTKNLYSYNDSAWILANPSAQVSGSIPTGANLIGKFGIDQTIPGNTNAVAMTASIESATTAPVVGSKSVTATAAEIFAGASVKASRRKLVIRNEDTALRLRVGSSSVTQQNGYPIEPGATVEIQFDPATAVAVFGISEGAALNVAVMEV